MTNSVTAKSWGWIYPDKSLGDRILKVDHAGEHGAVNIYRGQRHAFTLRSSSEKEKLREFQNHEEHHRALFLAQLDSRGTKQCPSYYLCGIGGYILGFITGLLGKSAVSATTYAVERVVLRHLNEQISTLRSIDPAACEAISLILSEEQQHHDEALTGFDDNGLWSKTVVPIVTISTEWIIWLGMRL